MTNRTTQNLAKNVVGLKLKCFGSDLRAKPHAGVFQTGWGQVVTHFEAKVSIESLTARIKTRQGLRQVQVRDTPHFAYAMHHLGQQGYDSERYITYIKEHFPSDDLVKRQRDFEWIIANIKDVLEAPTATRRILLRAKILPRRRLIIADGLHRCSAALAAGETVIPAAIAL